MPEPKSLDEKIRALVPEVNGTLRAELQQTLHTLRDAHNPVGVLVVLSRLSLVLLDELFAATGGERPSDNLWHCILRASAGKEKDQYGPKIEGLNILPRTLKENLDTIRKWSNPVDHADPQVPTPTEGDAENALNLFLRVVEWFYSESEKGPRLPTIYSEASAVSTPWPIVKSYLECMLRQNEQMIFPGLTREIPLYAIFLPSRVLEEPEPKQIEPQQKSASVETSEFFRDPGPEAEAALSQGEAVLWRDLRETASAWIVIGPAGSGKTTLLQWEASQCAESILQDPTGWKQTKNLMLPICASAREIASGTAAGKSFEDIVRECVATTLRKGGRVDVAMMSGELDSLVRNSWVEGRLLVLLDGLDEVQTGQRRDLLSALHHLITSTGNCVVVTSRPLLQGSLALGSIRTVHLARFDLRRYVPQFIRTWFSGVADGAERSERLLLELKRNSRLADVARTPLLLALMCLAVEHNEFPLPSRRVDLYESILVGLLMKWPISQARAARLLAGRFLALRELAWQSVAQPGGLPEEKALQTLVDSGKPFGWTYKDGCDLLQELTEVDGLLRVSQAGLTSVYTFFHPSFVDYLAAASAAATQSRLVEVLGSVDEEKWHGMLPLLAGMVSGPIDILDRIWSEVKIDLPVRIRLITDSLPECAEKLEPHVLAQAILKYAHDAQVQTSLPWRKLVGLDIVQTGLETLAKNDRTAAPIAALLAEFRKKTIQPHETGRAPSERVPEGVAHALSSLKSSSVLVRWAATWVLGVLRDPSCSTELTNYLNEAAPELRTMAAWALGILRDTSAAGVVRKALQDKESTVRKIAASSLGLLEDSEAVLPLLKVFQSDQLEVQRSAAWALGKLIDVSKVKKEEIQEVANLLTKLLYQDDPRLLAAVTSAVGNLPKNYSLDLGGVTFRLTELLRHDDSNVRAGAAYALAQVNDLKLAPIIAETMEDSDPRVRASAALALGRLKYSPAIPALSRALGERDDRVRRNANWALREMTDRESVLVSILSMFRTADPDGKLRILRSLQYWGDAEIVIKAAQDDLLAMLNDSDPRKRVQACIALQAYPTSEAVDRCISLLEDVNCRVRSLACNVLRVLREKKAVKHCLKLLEDTEPVVRLAACFFFQDVPDKGAIKPCRQLLGDVDPRVRASACGILGKLKDKWAVDACLELLADPEPVVRASACGFFHKVPDKRAVVSCSKLLTDLDPRVQDSARYALRKLQRGRGLQMRV